MMWIHVAALRYRVNQNLPLVMNKVCFRIFICVYIAYPIFGHPSLIWSILARIVSVTGTVFSRVPKTTKSTDSKPAEETKTVAFTYQSTPSAALVSDLKGIVVNFLLAFCLTENCWDAVILPQFGCEKDFANCWKNEHKAHLNFTVVKIGTCTNKDFSIPTSCQSMGDFFPLLSSPIKMSNIVYSGKLRHGLKG